MNETSKANIKQILTTFNHVITVYENPQWVKTVTSEDIKVAFKMGCFVENTMGNFKGRNCLEQFMKTAQVWAETNNKKLNYDEEFYSKMCDHLLVKFFKTKSVNEGVIDVAVRMYTSLFPKERLQVVLKDLLMTSASLDAILQFTAANQPSGNSIKHELVMDAWCKEVESGNKEKIIDLISDSVGSFKVANSLSILVGILALNRKNSVSTLIAEALQAKMIDRSILSKNFWLTLIKNIDKSYLGEVCVNDHDFFESFCNFLIYVGGMMEMEELSNKIRWVSNPHTSLCPEITYEELEGFFVFLCQFKNSVIKISVIKRLNEAQQCTDSAIWDQIKHRCL